MAFTVTNVEGNEIADDYTRTAATGGRWGDTWGVFKSNFGKIVYPAACQGNITAAVSGKLLTAAVKPRHKFMRRVKIIGDVVREDKPQRNKKFQTFGYIRIGE